ncbi:acyl-CoA dehydrogenase family protein [Streptomyces sp. NPDC000410]|uniref:acyl-CoA dehydrogenase family protein n=1 Tax=Streptomyces sp. NPDC000410 TaxID=3154254 RepID=UPI00332306D4
MTGMTEELDELRTAVRAVLTRHEGAAAWQPLTEQIGAAALAVPEQYGGLGCGAVETHVVVSELGRALSPVPYIGSAVLATQALLASGDERACAELLPGLADGAAVGALAWAEGGSWDPEAITTRAERAPDGAWLLTGAKEHVLAGPEVPDLLLVFARTDAGLCLFRLDDVRDGFVPLPTMDRTRPQARVALDRAPATLVGAEGDGARVLARVRDVACAALAAEQAGAAERALEITVQYAKDRVQFGRPIGSFQAVKHRLADLHAEVVAARSLALAAAYADCAPELAAAAKAACSEAYEKVAGEMIQLHGGIGITWEHAAHDFFKRAHSGRHLLGAPAVHRERLARLLGFP